MIGLVCFHAPAPMVSKHSKHKTRRGRLPMLERLMLWLGYVPVAVSDERTAHACAKLGEANQTMCEATAIVRWMLDGDGPEPELIAKIRQEQVGLH